METILTILPIITGIIGIIQNSGKLYSFWKNNISKEKLIPKYLEKEFTPDEVNALERSIRVLEYSKPILKIIFNKYLYRFAIIIIVFLSLVIANYLSIEIANLSIFEEYISATIVGLINYIICSPLLSNPFKLNFKNAIGKGEIIKELAKPTNKLAESDFLKVKITSKLDQEFIKGYSNLTNMVYTLFTYKLQDLIERERRNLTEVGRERIIEVINFSIYKLIEEGVLTTKPSESDGDNISKWQYEQVIHINNELKLTGLEVFVDFFYGTNLLKSDFVTIYKENKANGIKEEILKYW